MEVKQIGNLTECISRHNPNRRRVYDTNGLSPTLTSAMGEGGNLQPFVVTDVRQIGNMDTDRENFENPQCGRVYGSSGLSPTINTCQGGQREPKIIVAMRGRNPDNPSDRTAGSPTEQRLEPNSQGICNTLTSAQKDNMVLEPRLVGGIGEKWGDKQYRQGNRVYDSDSVAMALTSQPLGNMGGNSYMYLIRKPQYRIRKLTPLECWRLMGFSDEDFRKAEEVNSNSQLYKQAGNSIVKNVLMAIFGQMIPEKENLYKEL